MASSSASDAAFGRAIDLRAAFDGKIGVIQIEAVKAKLKNVEDATLRDQIEHCIEHAIASGDAVDQRRKAAELIQVLSHAAC